MQIFKSLIFNIILYTTLIPVALLIILLYPFVSTINLQKISSNWILFILHTLRIVCGITWEVAGRENIPETPFILVSNHQSAWESFYLQTLCFPSASIIKKELLYIPFFGWALACLKPIHLRRKKKIKSLKKVLSSGKKKISSGFTIIIFPEGTRSKPEDGIKKFSNSCGLLSIENNVPIVPICHNSGSFWINRRFTKKEGEVKIRIGRPMYGDKPKELTDKAYQWINRNFMEIT